jgi:hypothetical protein
MDKHATHDHALIGHELLTPIITRSIPLHGLKIYLFDNFWLTLLPPQDTRRKAQDAKINLTGTMVCIYRLYLQSIPYKQWHSKLSVRGTRQHLKRRLKRRRRLGKAVSPFLITCLYVHCGWRCSDVKLTQRPQLRRLRCASPLLRHTNVKEVIEVKCDAQPSFRSGCLSVWADKYIFARWAGKMSKNILHRFRLSVGINTKWADQRFVNG